MDSPTRRRASLLHQAQASRLQHANPSDAFHVIAPKMRSAVEALKASRNVLPQDITTARSYVMDQVAKHLQPFESLHTMDEAQWSQIEALAAIVDQCNGLDTNTFATRIEQFLSYGKLKTQALQLLERLRCIPGITVSDDVCDWSNDDAMWSKYIASGHLLTDDSIPKSDLAMMLQASEPSFPATSGMNWMTEALESLACTPVEIPASFVRLCDIDLDATPMRSGALCATYCGRYMGKRVLVDKLIDCSEHGQQAFAKELERRDELPTEHPNILHAAFRCPVGPWWCMVSERPEYGAWLTFCSVTKPTWTMKRELLLEAAEGLAFLHANNMVHGHVILDNLVVSSTPSGGYQAKWRWGLMATDMATPSHDATGDVQCFAQCILDVYQGSMDKKPDAMSPQEWEMVQSMVTGSMTMDEVVDVLQVGVQATRRETKLAQSRSFHNLLASSKSFRDNTHRSSAAPVSLPSANVNAPIPVDGTSPAKLGDIKLELQEPTVADATQCKQPRKYTKLRPEAIAMLLLWFIGGGLALGLGLGLSSSSSNQSTSSNSNSTNSSNTTNVTVASVNPLASRVYSVRHLVGGYYPFPSHGDGSLYSTSFLSLQKISGNLDGSELYVLDDVILRKIDIIGNRTTSFDRGAEAFRTGSSLYTAFPFIQGFFVNASVVYMTGQYDFYNISGYGEKTSSLIPNQILALTMYNGELYGANLTHVFNGVNGSRTEEILMCSPNLCPSSVRSLAIAHDGTIYIADYVGCRIFKKSLNHTVSVIGSGANSSMDGMTTQASFSLPTGITVDTIGNVFVAEQFGHRVRGIDPNGNVTTLSGVAGALNFSSPEDIFCDGNETLYLADSGDNVVYELAYE